MTAPVTQDDIVQGAVKYLLGFSEITDVLGTFPASSVPLLFQNQLYFTVEGSQSTAAVIIYAGSWGGANLHNTVNFPRISLEISVDPLRDAGQNVIDPGEATRRIHAVYKVFDRYLHRPMGGTVCWGDLRITESIRGAGPFVAPVPDGNGLLRLQVFYSVTEG